MIDRRLRVLQAVARQGTITAAAEACRLTPSAVSHQMQALARELDLVLLEPVGRNVRLTPAAHALLAHAEALAARWEQAQADLAAHRRNPVTGSLRFCAFSTAAARLVPPAMARLRDGHPGLSVHLRETEPARAFDLLATDEADIAVVVATPGIPPESDAAFTRHRLYAEPLDVLVGPDHPLAHRDALDLAEVAGDPWIVGTPGHAYHQLVTVACAGAGFAPAVAHHADEWDTGAALVAQGFGVALVPRLADLPAHHATRRIPVAGDHPPTRHVLAAVRAGSERRPLIAAGLEALQQEIATTLSTHTT
ncbi:LysR family transcriptional regulator [Pseudonocardia lutea]|uniref:LysR family transcriptional regulator n=1 Tax=Pseudonocardia lutea TaxID=2172015 RepID=A0ABW1I996_9PSEU